MIQQFGFCCLGVIVIPISKFLVPESRIAIGHYWVGQRCASYHYKYDQGGRLKNLDLQNPEWYYRELGFERTEIAH
jgi:hypothetical protein